MTSTARQELYQHANDNNVILQGVTSSGKHWQGRMMDALHPARPSWGMGRGDVEYCKGDVDCYVKARVQWAQEHPQPVGQIVEVVKEVIKEIPAPGPHHTILETLDGKPMATQVIEIPGGFTQEDIDAAVNDAIQELLANMGALAPAPAPALTTPAGEEPYWILQRENKALTEELGTQKLRYDDLALVNASLRDANGKLTAEIQKRDAVILTLREDFTRLLAEGEARSQERWEELGRLQSDLATLIGQRFDDARKHVNDNAPPDTKEKDLIQTRKRGWVAMLDKQLASVGLATDGTTVTAAKE